MNVSGVFYAIGVIFIILAAVAFLGVFSIGTAAPGTLLVVGIISLVVAYFLGSRAPRV